MVGDIDVKTYIIYKSDVFNPFLKRGLESVRDHLFDVITLENKK